MLKRQEKEPAKSLAVRQANGTRRNDRVKILAFSMLNLFKASDAQSTASCCISSDISAFLITALRVSDMIERGDMEAELFSIW